ncbi:sirohydrochlorin cobaltochelatase, partial [Klebsiella pneumoniae]|nr:sirohydrochlorin cobaltochelatase [Klebsiella pneumoniae]
MINPTCLPAATSWASAAATSFHTASFSALSALIGKWQQRDGIHIDTPLQALQKLAEQGYQDVAIQSLHIINGDEYEKI